MTIRYAPEWPDEIGPHVIDIRPYEVLCTNPICRRRTRAFYGEKPLCSGHAREQARLAKLEGWGQ